MSCSRNTRTDLASLICTMTIAATALTGCATVLSGTSQQIAIDTPGHDGAECVVASKDSGERSIVTPATIKVSRSKHDIQVTCNKGCFTGAALIASNLEGTAAGNLLVGGVIGAGVDSATGALNKYQTQTSVAMTRKRSCARKYS